MRDLAAFAVLHGLDSRILGSVDPFVSKASCPSVALDRSWGSKDGYCKKVLKGGSICMARQKMILLILVS